MNISFLLKVHSCIPFLRFLQTWNSFHWLYSILVWELILYRLMLDDLSAPILLRTDGLCLLYWNRLFLHRLLLLRLLLAFNSSRIHFFFSFFVSTCFYVWKDPVWFQKGNGNSSRSLFPLENLLLLLINYFQSSEYFFPMFFVWQEFNETFYDNLIRNMVHINSIEPK